MNLFESMLGALENLRSNKMRSFLTIIGIVVGIAAVVTIVSIGEAGKTTMAGELSQFGNETFVVYPNNMMDSSTYDNVITTADMEQIRSLEGIGSLTGTTSTSLDSKLKAEEIRFSVTGTTAEYAKIVTLKMEAGRFFNLSEERGRQQVVVVEGDYAVRAFVSADKAIGRKVTMGGKSYRIVGVIKSEEQMFSMPNKTVFTAYMPHASLPLNAEKNNDIESLYIKAKSTDEEVINAAVDRVKAYLAKRHAVPKQAYASQTILEAQSSINQVFGVLQTIVGSIAGISLLVGGIGVMNIMLVSVTERTREIGIRKAIGATPTMILQMFMIEAVFLCVIGGIVGTIIGLGGAFIFSLATGWSFYVSWATILVAFGFSAGVGIFFGLYPANKAARMHPIDSLRYE